MVFKILLEFQLVCALSFHGWSVTIVFRTEQNMFVFFLKLLQRITKQLIQFLICLVLKIIFSLKIFKKIVSIPNKTLSDESMVVVSASFQCDSLPSTLNVSSYRAQRSSVVYFPMMLSTMRLTPLRGEGNQHFHLQRRRNVEIQADSIFSSAVLNVCAACQTSGLHIFLYISADTFP